MSKLSIEDLDKIKQRVKRATFLREGVGRGKIIVHMGTCGIAAGAREIMNTLLEEFDERDIDDLILTSSGCAGLCSREPMVTVEMEDEAPVKYVDLTPEKIKKILVEHVLEGQVVEEYALAKGSEKLH